MALSFDAARAQISFDKEFVNDPVMPGDTVTLRFTIANSSGASFTNGAFTDDLSFLPGLVRTSTLSVDPNCGSPTIVGETSIQVSAIDIPGMAGTTTCTIDVALSVPANAPAGGYPNVTSMLTGVLGGEEPINQPGADDTLMVVVEEMTTTMVEAFLYSRANMLLEQEPDQTRIFRRLTGSLWDGGGAASFAGGSAFDRPMSAVMRDNGGKTRIDFATSLSQVGRSMDAARHRKERGAMGSLALDAADQALISPSTTGSGFDVWVEGHYQSFQSALGNADHDGHLGVIYVGTDYRVATSVIVGALVQFDWSEDKAENTQMGFDGHGWMAGPYMSARLSDHLFLMVRGAWGQSDNNVNPFGAYVDKFDTNRWLVTANLAGNWTHGDFRVTPNLWLKYFEETQDSYIDGMGMTIAGQTISLGRFSFGPEFGYRHVTPDGTVVEPHGSIIGIWDFDAPDSLTIMRVTGSGSSATIAGTTVVGVDDFRAKVEGGLIITNPSGTRLRIIGTYDGIGSDDLEAVGAEATLSFPLN